MRGNVSVIKNQLSAMFWFVQFTVAFMSPMLLYWLIKAVCKCCKIEYVYNNLTFKKENTRTVSLREVTKYVKECIRICIIVYSPLLH